MNDLPSQKILEQAWGMIRYLSSGGRGLPPAIADECRGMVIRARDEKEKKSP